MKIIMKFVFVALVVCFFTMYAVKASASQTCDAGCQECMQGCGNAEATCFEGCGAYGGIDCHGECEGEAQACMSSCYWQ